MQITDIQQLLAVSTYYTGGIDGDAGRLTWKAVEIIERTSAKRYATNPKRWSNKRRLIGAGQAVLDALGFEPGRVDGYSGQLTRSAFEAWVRENLIGSPEIIERKVVATMPEAIPLQRDRTRVYGKPGGKQCTAGKVELAYPMKLSWNKRRKLTKFSCHEAIADNLTAAFADILEHYGTDSVSKMGLDLFGGCFNYRRVRGGQSLSSHAWGIAVDIHPDKNRLRWGRDRALFAQPEYEPFLEIMASHDMLCGGTLWGKDFMHYQRAR